MINLQPQRIVGIGLSAIMLVMLAVVTTSIWRLHSLEDTLNEVAYDFHLRSELTGNMQDAARQRLLLLQKILTETAPFARDALTLALRDQGERFLTLRERLLALDTDTDHNEIVLLDEQAKAARQSAITVERVIEFDRSNQRDAARALFFIDVVPLQGQVLIALEKLLKLHTLHIQQASEKAHRNYKVAVKELVLMSIIGVCLSIGIGWLATARIRRVMARVQRLLHNLRRTSRRERAIKRTMLDGVITADANGIIRHENPAVEALLGYPRGELIGKNLSVLTPEPHRTNHDHYMQHYLDTGQRRVIGSGREVDALHRDGHLVPIELGVVHIRQNDEDIFVGFLHDIRLRKENENLLSQAKTQLEEKVKSRTEELEQANQRLAKEVAERELVQQQLALQASHDVLTGLPNRRFFHQRLEELEAAARRHEKEFALLYLDLDGFKAVNDQHGHHAGDELLKIIAKQLRAALRREDVLARLGGDEFAVLVTDTTTPALLAYIAEKLITATCQPVVMGEIKTNVGVSIGIGRYPQAAQSTAELLLCADKAMYQAKQTGRGRYCFAPEPSDKSTGQD